MIDYAAGASGILCTKYSVDDAGEGGTEGYYERMIPGHCRARHLGNWRPTFKVVRKMEPWFT